ncbi:hypothetical protein [Gordonia shandongensis]|uniref:hypothetical protein n=1 Tax=Gordonia shandongensis TaxID=376351 RepID=UPI0003F5481A|nr:hypothetical protein [Gordonia shandongensis]
MRLARVAGTVSVTAVMLGAVVTGAGAGTAQALPGLPPLPPLPTLPTLPSIPGLPAPPPTVDLQKSFSSLSRSLTKATPGRIGLALTPTGGARGQFFGTVRTARAWSTLKVPVAVAAERAGVDDLARLESSSIRRSDNDAAETLWTSLGSTREAVDAVTGVLREGGDTRTRVISELSRPPGFPGATRWATTDQSVFAANLPCLDGADPVLRNMGSVAANQRWGLARSTSRTVRTAVKGGWGPVSDETGRYVVRQLAVVTTSRGSMGVSLVALPKSGTFVDGQRMLTRMAGWVRKNLRHLTVGACGPALPRL